LFLRWMRRKSWKVSCDGRSLCTNLLLLPVWTEAGSIQEFSGSVSKEELFA
jgi:hypothetical protein